MDTSTKNKLGMLVAVILAGFAWWFFTPKHAPVGSTVIAKQAPELKDQPKQDIKPPKISVFTPAAKKKLALPAIVQDDPNKYVIGSAKLPKDTHPHTITTVIDEKTGGVQTYDRRDPLPWLAAERTGEVWVGYGITNGGIKVGMVSVSDELVQVKALHFGVNASLTTNGSVFAGAGVGYRW